MSVFVLGRMRHLDLLAVAARLGMDDSRLTAIGRLSKERVVTALLEMRPA